MTAINLSGSGARNHHNTVVTKEFARDARTGDIPFYPLRSATGNSLLARYVARAKALKNVSFLGRLGTYRYLDMDVAIREARKAARDFLAAAVLGQRPAVFSRSPLTSQTR